MKLVEEDGKMRCDEVSVWVRKPFQAVVRLRGRQEQLGYWLSLSWKAVMCSLFSEAKTLGGRYQIDSPDLSENTRVREIPEAVAS